MDSNDAGGVSVEAVKHVANAIEHKSSTSTALTLEDVTFLNTAVSTVSTLEMSGDLTNTGGNVLLTSVGAQAITHTGAGSANADLSMTSTNGAVNIESIKFTSSALTCDDAITITSTNDAVSVESITFTSAALSSTTAITVDSNDAGGVSIESIKFVGNDVTNIGSLTLDKGTAPTPLATSPSYDATCSSSNPCGLCVGSCSADDQCAGNLVCVSRTVTSDTLAQCGTVASEYSAIDTAQGSVVSYCVGYPDVSSNTAAGSVSLSNYETAANSCESATFALLSDYISSTSVVQLSVTSYSGNWGSQGIPSLHLTGIEAGKVNIMVCNTGASALAGLITFNFIVL